jgi:hypothetical protein
VQKVLRIVNYHELEDAKDEDVLTRESYILPPHAKWESLYIKFINRHEVQVSYPNMKSRKFDYKDMGFRDGKTGRPDIKWLLLEAMAEYGGSLTKEDGWNRKFTRNAKYELNKKLRLFFGMKENPIENYTKRNGYVAIFTLRGDR